MIFYERIHFACCCRVLKYEMKKEFLLPLLLTAGAMHYQKGQEIKPKPQPQNGDVIRVNRGLYSHYGVYVADCEHVIHYTGATGPDDFNGIVRETSLAEFLNGAETFSVCSFPEKPQNISPFSGTKGSKNGSIFQLWQALKALKLRDYHLYSGDETVKRARSRLGQGGYNLALNNCEHFAVWCRTGVSSSSQVNNILDLITSMLS